MFLRVNGLFGWVRVNDRRSILLLASFIAVINAAAALSLYPPLLLLDHDHAPIVAWGGYAARYLPLVTLAAAGCFGAQMLWHVGSVQRTVAFEYVDDRDEPRLCALVEPLAIGIGLPAPYVGVIESRALNAFACGLGRRNAVVVVTRGLIDALDDDELSAVLAHELAHIANGDIRLLAAANVCLRMTGLLVRTRLRRSGHLSELLAFPVMAAMMPPLFLFVLIIGLCAQSILRGSRLIRLSISSSREFVADARAVELTQNPAALVAALKRIDGRSHLADLPPGQDAMMIAGACEGGFATHPTIARRIEAIVAVTGSMALIAPPRRDTRRSGAAAPAGSPIRAGVFGGPAPACVRHRSALGRVGVDDDRNWLGLTPTMTAGAGLAVALVFGLPLWRQQSWTAPFTLDRRSTDAVVAILRREATCNLTAVGTLTLGRAKPAECEAAARQEHLAVQAREATGPMGRMLSAMTQPPAGMYAYPGGGFGTVPPPDVEAAEVASQRCYRTRGYAPGDAGWHRIDEPSRRDAEFNIRRWLAGTEALAEVAGSTGLDASDKPLKAYIEGRKVHYELVDHFFGDPGIVLLREAYASQAHRLALLRLRERLANPNWAAGLSPVALAEVTLLATRPDDFVTCMARRRMAAQHP